MSTTAGELREMLIRAIEDVRDKKMDPSAAKVIALLAGQINLSVQVETNARAQAYEIGGKNVLPVGLLPLGEERKT